MIKTVSATQIDNPDANSEPFPVLYVVVAGLIAFLILSLAIIIACVTNRGSTASPATESFISISTTVLSVLEVVMLYRSEFFPKLWYVCTTGLSFCFILQISDVRQLIHHGSELLCPFLGVVSLLEHKA
jgi:hypothetical protein